MFVQGNPYLIRYSREMIVNTDYGRMMSRFQILYFHNYKPNSFEISEKLLKKWPNNNKIKALRGTVTERVLKV